MALTQIQVLRVTHMVGHTLYGPLVLRPHELEHGFGSVLTCRGTSILEVQGYIRARYIWTRKHTSKVCVITHLKPC